VVTVAQRHPSLGGSTVGLARTANKLARIVWAPLKLRTIEQRHHKLGLRSVRAQERIGRKHICASLKRLETGSNILHTPNFQRDHREAERASRCLNLTHVPQGDRIAGLGQNR